MFVCVYRQFVDLSQRREKKKNCGFWWLPIRFFRRWFRLSPKVSRRATAIFFVLFYFVLTLFGLFCFFLIASWLSVSQLCVSLPDWMESNITHTHTHANNGKIKIKKNFLFFSFLPHLCFFRPIRRDGLVDSSDFPPPFFYTEWNEKRSGPIRTDLVSAPTQLIVNWYECVRAHLSSVLDGSFFVSSWIPTLCRLDRTWTRHVTQDRVALFQFVMKGPARSGPFFPMKHTTGSPMETGIVRKISDPLQTK